MVGARWLPVVEIKWNLAGRTQTGVQTAGHCQLHFTVPALVALAERATMDVLRPHESEVAAAGWLPSAYRRTDLDWHHKAEALNPKP